MCTICIILFTANILIVVVVVLAVCESSLVTGCYVQQLRPVQGSFTHTHTHKHLTIGNKYYATFTLLLLQSAFCKNYLEDIEPPSIITNSLYFYKASSLLCSVM